MDIKTLVELIDDLDSSSLLELWNYFCEESNCEDEKIYENDEYFIDEVFSSPFEALKSAYYGDYNVTDNFVTFNGYGNLKSADFVEDLIYVDDLAHWLIDRQDVLEEFDLVVEEEE